VQYTRYPVLGGGGGGGVSSLNALTGAVTLAAGNNITLTPSWNTITIAETSGGLVPDSGLVFTADLSSSAGYTFDPTKTAFSGGMIIQIPIASDPITPINIANITVTGNSIQKTGGVGGSYDAGAYSAEQITSGNGSVSFTPAPSVASASGLTPTNTTPSYTDIQYAIVTDLSNGFYVFENGTLIAFFGSYSGGDVFSVVVNSGAVAYKKNGVTFYNSAVAPVYPLFFKSSISTANGIINNILFTAPADYDADVITFPAFNYSGVGHVLSFNSSSISDANGPHYTLNGLYWNGSAWVTSNETYAQSNIQTDIGLHIPTLPAADSLLVKMITNDGAVQMSLSALSITYTGQIYPGMTNILAFTSNPSIGGAVSEAMTVTGLLATDTILAVTQMTQGGATRTSLPLIGWDTVVNNGLTAHWVANPGVGAVLLVAVKR
jgi:hypothetical protein